MVGNKSINYGDFFRTLTLDTGLRIMLPKNEKNIILIHVGLRKKNENQVLICAFTIFNLVRKQS